MRPVFAALALLGMVWSVPGAPAQTADPGPPSTCTPDRTGGEPGWRLVEGAGFTFCVPPHWRSDARGRWADAAVTLQSGRGRARLERRTATVVATSEEVAEAMATARATEETRSTEEVEGLRVNVRVIRNGRTGATTVVAEWSGPGAGHLLARDESGAQTGVVRQVVRSVRRDAP